MNKRQRQREGVVSDSAAKQLGEVVIRITCVSEEGEERDVDIIEGGVIRRGSNVGLRSRVPGGGCVWTWMVVGLACFMYDGNVVACTSRLCHGRV
ncbi:hypothetical protein DY000_02042716 [Brassica cretica]|uniref:Uncharacterized protein n=1 Tax=Brassica cretica TaxID=69181 RepID=A0ABQ7BCP9_BRACR|nr:hypothetical protein DY000_02042716 [Brassica cretica]